MITKEEIHKKADLHLLTNLGQFIGAGEPVFDRMIEVWIVTVFHKSNVATFPVGEMLLDKDGNVLDAPTDKDIDGVFERKFEGNEKLKEKFELVATT